MQYKIKMYQTKSHYWLEGGEEQASWTGNGLSLAKPSLFAGKEVRTINPTAEDLGYRLKIYNGKKILINVASLLTS